MDLARSLFWDFEFSIGNCISNVTRRSAINGAANRLQKQIQHLAQERDEYKLLKTYHAGSQNLLDSANKVSGLGSGPHDPGNADHLIEGDVTIVLNCR